MEGHQFWDVSLVANKVLEEYRDRGKEGVIFITILSKLTNHVDWNFLNFVMDMKRCGVRWKKETQNCLSPSNLLVFANDEARESFKGFT